jgi:hypothetical protein
MCQPARFFVYLARFRDRCITVWFTICVSSFFFSVFFVLCFCEATFVRVVSCPTHILAPPYYSCFSTAQSPHSIWSRLAPFPTAPSDDDAFSHIVEFMSLVQIARGTNFS